MRSNKLLWIGTTQPGPERGPLGWRNIPPHGGALSSPRPGSVRGNRCWLAVLGKTRRTLRQDKSRKGGRECDLKPFVAIQRVQLTPGRGEPASRKRALHGWWQHHS